MTYSIRHSPKYAMKNTKQTPDSHWLWLSVYLGITALYRWAKFQIPLRLLIFWYNISMQNTTFGILIRHFNTNFIKNGIGSWFQRGTKIQNDHLYPENQLNMNFVLTCIINNVVLMNYDIYIHNASRANPCPSSGTPLDQNNGLCATLMANLYRIVT